MSLRLLVQDLSVTYGRHRAVDRAHLAVPEGKVVALLGPNGAGKSSVLRAIAGLAPREGRIELDGSAIDDQPAHKIARMGLCLIPEGRGVFPTLTVKDNLRIAAPENDRDFAERVLDFYPALRTRVALPAGALSGGEQQMLSLARAVGTSTRLLAIDEPSLGLAPKLVTELFATMRRLRDDGRTILLVEQYATHALAIADLVYVMAQGRVVFAGEPGELEHAPPLIDHYLGRLTG